MTDKKKKVVTDPRKLDFADPVKPITDIERRNFTPELSRKNLKGREGQAEKQAKTKAIGPELLKKALLAALEKSLGVVATACRMAECSRDMHYWLMKNDDDYAEKVAELSNLALDFVESKLFEKIKEKDAACIIFYLKTKGKHRGYVEKIEIENPNKQKWDLTKLNEEEIMMLSSIQMKMDGIIKI